MPKPWRKQYFENVEKVRAAIHETNACHRQLLDLWFREFDKLRLVNTSEFHTRTEALELQAFQQLYMRHIESAREQLNKKCEFLFSDLHEIYYTLLLDQ